tara:strand:- start:203 stop:1135 length:933 start_codon:yes stop_codon:yes gene_type:complete
MVNNIKKYKDYKINKIHKKSIILIGNFDGLHLGHQKLFRAARKIKKKYKTKIGVFTFYPMPKMFFNKKIKNYKISNFEQKLNYFKKFGVDFIINKKFNKKFSKISCHDFIIKILSKELNIKYIFVSNNFRFGHNRKGNIKLLKYYQKIYNYKLITPKPFKKEKKIISSTYIRKLLERGYLNKANKLLNRNWSVEGKVEKGRKIGRKVGFPTCNIDIGNYVISKPGVYAVNVKIPKIKKKYKGIANLGYRPTFKQKKILLEVNLFNFSGNLYNKKLSVEFLKFIRGERKFKGFDDLRNQIKKDVLIAKNIR